MFFNHEVENLYTKMVLVMKQNKTDYSSLFLPYFTADLLIMGIPCLSIIKIWNNSQYTKHHTLKNRWGTITGYTKTEQLKVQST